MIRFPCPLCHKTLKAPDEKAGAKVICPRCQEVSVVPSADPAYGRGEGSGVMLSLGQSPGAAAYGRDAPAADQNRGLFSGMSTGLRAVVALVAAVGILSLLLAVLAPVLRLSEDWTATVRQEAAIMVPSCLVILFVVLYGHATSCPACGKWWARTEGETESLGREEIEKKGVPWVRAKCRTTYACKHCRHTWSATYTDEYQGTLHPRKGRSA
jgi:hypothetical protein